MEKDIKKTFSAGTEASMISIMVTEHEELKCDDRSPTAMPTSGGHNKLECLYLLSQCMKTVEYADWANDNALCDQYLRFTDFAKFLAATDRIVSKLEDKIGETTILTPMNTTKLTTKYETFREEECVDHEWLSFLLLLLPLIVLILFRLCVNMKRKKVKVIKKPKEMPVVKMPPPPPVNTSGPPPPPKVAPKKTNSKYKWETAPTDQYLWSGTGGTKPMKVNWAGEAPESAPRDPNGDKILREIKSWENDDGEILMEVEVEQDRTFEQFAEDNLEDMTNSIKRTFCCCCCDAARKSTAGRSRS